MKVSRSSPKYSNKDWWFKAFRIPLCLCSMGCIQCLEDLDACSNVIEPTVQRLSNVSEYFVYQNNDVTVRFQYLFDTIAMQQDSRMQQDR